MEHCYEQFIVFKVSQPEDLITLFTSVNTEPGFTFEVHNYALACVICSRRDMTAQLCHQTGVFIHSSAPVMPFKATIQSAFFQRHFSSCRWIKVKRGAIRVPSDTFEKDTEASAGTRSQIWINGTSGRISHWHLMNYSHTF